MQQQLMIHTIQPGDLLTMLGPDGLESAPFVLGEMPSLRGQWMWLYREADAPIVVERLYGLDATFVLHRRDPDYRGRHRDAA